MAIVTVMGTLRGRALGWFGLWAHPNTVLIDRKGRVVGLVREERDWQSEAARRLVHQLLQEGREASK